MASPIISGIGNLTNAANSVAATAQSILAAGSVADLSDLWPVQNWGDPSRLPLAGVPNIEPNFHFPFEQGRFLERPIGDAISAIQTKQLDLQEKILTYVNLHKVALDAQLSHLPRTIALAADAITLVQQIRTYVDDGLNLLNALQANMQVLQAAEARMLGMIQANINALANLLQEICNWKLPSLPSLASLLGGMFHWNGFNFNLPSGFNFNPSLALITPNFNFSFSSCVPRTANLASVFGATPTSVSVGDETASLSVPTPPLSGTIGDAARLTDPTYISEMQATATPVYNPTTLAADAASSAPGTSLPDPASIISNYSLPASTYVSNICSVVTALKPLVIQPDDPDYAAAQPSASVLANLRATLIQYVNLGTVVSSGYDPNLTAAWLIYLNLNRVARGGQWLANFQAEYVAQLTASITYVMNTPVPWNNVLGGDGVSAAPTAIPLIAALQADTTNNLKWRLSYIEASLLGYPRNPTWDAAADTVYLDSFTGSDLDYEATIVNATPTTTLILGDETADYPVSCIFPTSIGTVLAQVVALAATSILTTPSYQSPRPQFRYTYNMFAQPTLVDRFSQFWRDFNANLQSFLAQAPYVVGFVCSYVDALNAAVNPLASNADYLAIQTDADSRSRTWTPGSAMPSVPVATVLTGSSTAPTDLTNGWSTGTFDASAFLARPDVQAQSLPVQVAMLRTNQSFATLMTLKSNVMASVQAAVTNAQTIASSICVPGWEVESNVDQVVPVSVTLPLSLAQVDFNTTGYVTSDTEITSQASAPFIINAIVNWDTTGGPGTRTITLTQNGTAVATNSATSLTGNPFLTQFSTVLNLNTGDVLQLQASHTCTTAQTVLGGSSFLGLVDPGGAGAISSAVNTSSSSTLSLVAGTALAAATAVAIRGNGQVLAVNPNTSTQGASPFVDGITLAAAASGNEASVATGYGQVYTFTGASFTPDALLYVNSDGTLTQDYSTITQNVAWTVCVGRAITATTFLFQPHLPTANG